MKNKFSLGTSRALFGALSTTIWILSALFITSCSKDNPDSPVDGLIAYEIRLKLPDGSAMDDLSAIKIDVRDLRNNTSTEHHPDAKGICELSLDKGVYTFQARGEIAGSLLTGSAENLSITTAGHHDLQMKVQPIRAEGFVLGEVFFNGETNMGRMMHPDQYLTIFNNSDKTLYADGLCIALTAHANPTGEDEFTREMKQNNRIPVALIYAIPGKGSEHPVKPGEQIVIARSAQNHKDETHPNSVDLSGANFEAADPNSKDIGKPDNPAVPNLEAHYSAFGMFMMHPRGFMPVFIFKVDKDMKAFLSENQFEYTDKNQKKKMAYAIPVSMILDGIETGNTGALKVKSLPNAIDQGFVGVPGCHQGLLCIRKSDMRDGRKYLKDTNNSTVDCEMRSGQNSYPAGR